MSNSWKEAHHKLVRHLGQAPYTYMHRLGDVLDLIEYLMCIYNEGGGG